MSNTATTAPAANVPECLMCKALRVKAGRENNVKLTAEREHANYYKCQNCGHTFRRDKPA